MADSQVNVSDAIGELKGLVLAEIKRSEELSETSHKLNELAARILNVLSSLESRVVDLEARLEKLERQEDE